MPALAAWRGVAWREGATPARGAGGVGGRSCTHGVKERSSRPGRGAGGRSCTHGVKERSSRPGRGAGGRSCTHGVKERSSQPRASSSGRSCTQVMQERPRAPRARSSGRCFTRRGGSAPPRARVGRPAGPALSAQRGQSRTNAAARAGRAGVKERPPRRARDATGRSCTHGVKERPPRRACGRARSLVHGCDAGATSARRRRAQRSLLHAPRRRPGPAARSGRAPGRARPQCPARPKPHERRRPSRPREREGATSEPAARA